jgi:hypothetical protein
MCNTCKMQSSNGDMASRMGICKDTNKPVPYFHDIKSLINSWATKLNLSIEDANITAFGFLNEKRNTAPDGIYFCEDVFYNDLNDYFKLLSGQKVDSISSEAQKGIRKRFNQFMSKI